MPNIDEIFNISEQPFTKKDKELLIKSYEFAQKAHDGQKRDSGEPYFIHVFETAKNLTKLGMDANTIAAGFLHDTIEDTAVTEEDVKREFGDEILFLVKGVTKLGTLKYRGHERHVESLRKFFLAMAQDLRVVTIKLADRLHNIQTLSHKAPEKQKRIALETIEIHARLADRLGMGKLKSELEDAAFPFAYPKEYTEIEALVKDKVEEYKQCLSDVHVSLEKILKEERIAYSEISYRIKHKYSIWKKLHRYDMDIDKIHDIVALRVVVKNVDNCYRVLGLIHAEWKPLPGRIKDYIALPKPNGYRSLHTTILTNSGCIAEIQIRTTEMHAEAAYGIAAHFAYKENAEQKGHDDASKFKWLEDLQNFNTTQKEQKKFLDNLKTDFFGDRIFILTPKGDVVDLPEGSTAVDFAYAIHSDIGEKMAGVKVDGRMASIEDVLKNGSVIEIITRKDAHPSAKWLEFAKTNLAKRHIRAYIEQNSLMAKFKSFGQS